MIINHSLRRWRGALFLCLLVLCNSWLKAQVSPVVPATTVQHSKQVIGYITQWDAWKEVAGIVPKGGYNHLNVDYSQYTILNFSFFGVAQDGSLHSGDYRNKNIYQVGAVQAPAALFNTDIYSSWDLYLMYGELETLYYIPDGSYSYNQGYRNEGGGWKNVNTGETGTFPLAIHKEGGAPGLLELAHQKGVKVLASIGGWSMCKHYPEMAADATKRAKFVADCQKLINMGFDGIDFDWEYPNDAGMNIEHYSAADYTNFAILLEQVRAAIGSSKLMTSCFAAASAKLQGFNWPRLSNVLNYFNMMTYDYNGGWSNKAGHNAPLYDYPGAEYSNFSIHATVTALRNLGVTMSKVNIGAPFYGRGVITSGTAALNAATVKRAETVQPDGPIQTCADYTNWAKDLWDGTPSYSYIQKATATGWTDHWDDVAKVPYKTNGSYFLSYDNERSVGEKAQYIKDNGLAGVIIWQVYADMTNMTSSTVAKGKLIYCPNTTNPLLNKMNAVFASGSIGNVAPTVNITAPANNATYTAPATVSITATAADADGTVSKVELYNGSSLLTTIITAPYAYTWSNVTNGTYTITAKATDNGGAVTTSSAITIVVGTGGSSCNGIAAWSAAAVYVNGNQAVYNNKIYQAKWWTQNEQPDTHTGDGQPWAYVSDCSGGGTTDPGTDPEDPDEPGTGGICAGIAMYQPYPSIYNAGDKVVYNGILYQSLANSLYNVTPGTADWWWLPLGTCSATLRVTTTSSAAKETVGKEAASKAEKATDATWFKIYPNPVRNELRIYTNGVSLFGCLIRIYDVTGRQVLTVRPASNSIDVSRLPAGIYTLVYTNDGQVINRRFIK